jgi:hypothetical protein
MMGTVAEVAVPIRRRSREAELGRPDSAVVDASRRVRKARGKAVRAVRYCDFRAVNKALGKRYAFPFESR